MNENKTQKKLFCYRLEKLALTNELAGPSKYISASAYDPYKGSLSCDLLRLRATLTINSNAPIARTTVR